MPPPDAASVIRSLAEANVQFVVVGDLPGDGPLRLVVWRHPTNLVALGTALDRMGSTLRAGPAVGARAPAGDPVRVGDQFGTVSVTAGGGEVELYFGGPDRSLYAETLERSESRDIGGTTVPWAPVPPAPERPGRPTGRATAGRLAALAEEVAHLVERRDLTDPPVDGPPVDGPPVDVPAVDVPAVDVPAVDVPAVDVPAVDVPAVDVPAVDVPAGDAADEDRIDADPVDAAGDEGDGGGEDAGLPR